jgi:threonine dehydratase
LFEIQMPAMLTFADVLAARRVVKPHIWRTPLLYSPALSHLTGGEVYLKLECWQQTGSFKVRGALARLASLAPDELMRDIVTASAGNHGLGVAYACQALGLPPAIIFVPEQAAQTKLDRLATFRCRVHRAGADYDSAHILAEAYAQDNHGLYLSAYDDPALIAGQGTASLEMMEELPTVDLFLVPVGGGGLIAGTAIVAKAIRPAVRILGVQPKASPAAYLSLRDGQPYETYPAGSTICDGLSGGFGRVPFELAGELIDQVVVVPEAAVRQAIAWLLAHEQLVAEASGAIAIAPLLTGQLDVEGRKVAAVITGRNIDVALLNEITKEQLDEQAKRPTDRAIEPDDPNDSL